MKLYAILILAGLGLGGCIAVPYGQAPGPYAGVYVVPPPLVVGRPFYGYYGRGYYGRGYGGYGRY